MPEHSVELAKIDWIRTFPWVRLFRVFRTAIDLRMLLLGSMAVVLLACGDAVLSHLPFASADGKLESPLGWDTRPQTPPPLALPELALKYPWLPALAAATNGEMVLRPARTVFNPIRTILRADVTWGQKTFAFTRLLWAMCVWAIVAGAMCRVAAVEQGGETKISLVSALRFSLKNFPSYITASVLPAAGIAIFWILCLVGGLFGRLPYVGPSLLGLLWGLELLVGFIMALILIGAAAGWPLMYATISTEASDGFDGFSRAYSYVFSRPWHYLWFSIVAFVYGACVVTFVHFVASLVVYLTAAGVASSLGTSATNGLLWGAPDSLGGAGLLIGTSAGTFNLGTLFVGAWIQAVGLLVSGFITSYFWTATTVIYLLLRQVDDATDFHEVSLPEESEADELLPLVGVAASEQPVIERPREGDFAARPATHDARSPDGHQAGVSNQPGLAPPLSAPPVPAPESGPPPSSVKRSSLPAS